MCSLLLFAGLTLLSAASVVCPEAGAPPNRQHEQLPEPADNIDNHGTRFVQCLASRLQRLLSFHHLRKDSLLLFQYASWMELSQTPLSPRTHLARANFAQIFVDLSRGFCLPTNAEVVDMLNDPITKLYSGWC